MQVRAIGLLSLLVLALALSGGVVVADHGGLHVTNTTYGADERVPSNATESTSLYFWVSEPFRIDASLDTGNVSGNYRACVDARPADNGSTQRLTCQPTTLDENETRTITFSSVSPPKNATGKYHVDVVIESSLDGENVGNQTMTVVFISKTGDLDKDGLQNQYEVTNNTYIDNPDSDTDTLSDGAEVNSHGTEPTKVDTDGDGLGDALEIQRETDPLLTDTDGDGLDDALEIRLGTNPTSATTPLFFAGGLLFVGAAAVVVYWRRSTRQASDASTGRPAAPVTSGGTDVATPTMDGEADADFVSDEERIVQLLADNGGRMMQSRLVELTDWSKSKVSRRLSTLEEEGRIRKITLGRENMVALPGHEPEGAQSPFEDESSEP